jgi:hypothetical protein
MLILLKTGQIGDTIGGLTAPFLNFLSIILLYLTLREQTEVNRRQRNYDSLNNLVNTIKTDFKDLEIYQTQNGQSNRYSGTRAIFEMRNLLLNCNDISTCLDEASLRAFNLSFTFLTYNIVSFLKKNFESNINKEEKIEYFQTINSLKTPVAMLFHASGIYYTKRKAINNGQNITELIS